jgi:hypothetical protein
MYIPCEASSWTLLHQNWKLSSRISLQNQLFCLCRLPAVNYNVLIIFIRFSFGLVYETISLYSSSSIIQYRLLPMNQIFNLFKLTRLYWFYNGFEDYSICHLNWQCSGYNIFSVYIYLPVNFIYKIFSGWVRWFINQRRK